MDIEKLLPLIKEKAILVLKYIGIAVFVGICLFFVLAILLFVSVFALNYKWNEVLYVFASCVSLMLLITLAIIHVRRAVQMAFSDPEVLNYGRKTDKELFTFLAQSCVVAFLFALISFNIAW